MPVVGFRQSTITYAHRIMPLLARGDCVKWDPSEPTTSRGGHVRAGLMMPKSRGRDGRGQSQNLCHTAVLNSTSGFGGAF